MKTDHAHVEAASLALIVLGLIVIIDIFINLGDGHPVKPLVYAGGFLVIYLVLYIIRRKAWKSDS